MLIAVMNQKGGVGKTTVATHLAVAGARAGKRVLLVDADRQASARDWHAAGDGCGVQVIGVDTPSSVASLTSVSKAYDLVVIDGAPSASLLSAALLKVVDRVVIPVQPSPYDIWAADALVGLIHERQALADGEPKAWFLVNRAIPRTALSSDVVSALESRGLPTLTARTHQRVSYANSAAFGGTVFQTSDRGAQAEIEAIFNEVTA